MPQALYRPRGVRATAPDRLGLDSPIGASTSGTSLLEGWRDQVGLGAIDVGVAQRRFVVK